MSEQKKVTFFLCDKKYTVTTHHAPDVVERVAAEVSRRAYAMTSAHVSQEQAILFASLSAAVELQSECDTFRSIITEATGIIREAVATVSGNKAALDVSKE